MAHSPVVILDDDIVNETSTSDLNLSSTSMNTSSPKVLGRTRNYIWSHFIDEGEAKTGGYRKARCRYCSIILNYAKIPLMYTHIANQCDTVVLTNPAGRMETISKLSELDASIQSPKVAKRTTQVVDYQHVDMIHLSCLRKTSQIIDVTKRFF